MILAKVACATSGKHPVPFFLPEQGSDLGNGGMLRGATTRRACVPAFMEHPTSLGLLTTAPYVRERR